MFVCRCCERKRFNHQVTEVDIKIFKEKVNTQKQGIFLQCITSYNKGDLHNQLKENVVTSFEIKKKNYICKGCKVAMERGKMPKMSSNNGLTVDVIPEGLILTELENNCIAKNIIFQKLHKKPKYRWSGTNDRLVKIPIGDQDV